MRIHIRKYLFFFLVVSAGGVAQGSSNPVTSHPNQQDSTASQTPQPPYNAVQPPPSQLSYFDFHLPCRKEKEGTLSCFTDRNVQTIHIYTSYLWKYVRSLHMQNVPISTQGVANTTMIPSHQQQYPSNNPQQYQYKQAATQNVTAIGSRAQGQAIPYSAVASRFNQNQSNVRREIGRNTNYVPSEKTIIQSCNITPEPVKLREWKNATVHHLIQAHKLGPLDNAVVERESVAPFNTFPSNGFVSTVLDAYRNHHNLIIRPDDVWTSIITQLSFYINGHAEEMRKHFVTHTDKKLIKINFRKPLEEPEPHVIAKRLVEKLQQNLHKNKRGWIQANFSTTTDDDRLVYSVVMLSSMQSYFKYMGVFTCGIPQTTILGTKDDWVLMREKVHRLGDIERDDINRWVSLLDKILLEFIASKGGDVNVDFWGNICRLPQHGCDNDDDVIDGWITAFTAFNSKGEWIISDDPGSHEWPAIQVGKIAPGVVSVQLEVQPGTGRPLFTTTLYAGHIGQTVVNRVSLQPFSGFAWTFPHRSGEGVATVSEAFENEAGHNDVQNETDISGSNNNTVLSSISEN